MIFPHCRENQFSQLLFSINNSNKVILLSGPMASGKTYSVKYYLSTLDKELFKSSHVYCDNGDKIADVLTETTNQLLDKPIKKRINSFRQFLKVFISTEFNYKAVVVFDSFDLLEDESTELLKGAIAINDSKILKNFVFIFITHVNPAYFQIDPFEVFNVLFESYTIKEIEKIILSYYGENQSNEELGIMIRKIISIAEPITKDLRDLIFIAHTVIKSNIEQNMVGKEVLNALEIMRTQKICKTNGLSTMASILLLALYIASKTSPLSDLMKFARSIKKRRKTTKLIEEHDYVSLERVFAISKALIYSHIDGIEFDYSAYTALQQLSDLELIEIRGDLFKEPKLKNLATEAEITSIAEKLDIQIHEYVSEK